MEAGTYIAAQHRETRERTSLGYYPIVDPTIGRLLWTVLQVTSSGVRSEVQRQCLIVVSNMHGYTHETRHNQKSDHSQQNLPVPPLGIEVKPYSLLLPYLTNLSHHVIRARNPRLPVPKFPLNDYGPAPSWSLSSETELCYCML